MTVDSRRKLAFLSKDSGTQGHHHGRRQGPVEPADRRLPADVARATRRPASTTAASSGRSAAASRGRKLRGLGDRHPRSRASLHLRERVRGDGSRARRSTRGSTHSVDVDFDGVAWVSGSGGARGWWTEGLHKDTATGQMRYATPVRPAPLRRRLGRRRHRHRSCTTPTTCRRRSATRRRATCC